MSFETHPVPSRVDATAQRWFARLLAPDCTEAQRQACVQWQAENPAHAAAYARVQRAWEYSLLLGEDPATQQELQDALRPAAVPAHASLQLRPRTRASADPARRQRVRGWAAAAVAAMLVLATGLGLRHLLPQAAPMQTFATALGQTHTVALADASEVILDTDSALDVRFDDQRRALALRRGQADFQVASDPRRPFVVEAGRGQVVATGTRFQVRVEQGASTVTLLEGRVTVSARGPGGTQQVNLVPNERIVIEADGRLARRERLDAIAMAAVNGWTQGQLVISERPLRSVLEEMNRYAGTRLALADPALGDMVISGVFRTGDVGAFVTAMEHGWGLRAQPHATRDEVLLERK